MKLSPGDIVEIRTGSGLRYVQVTHNHVSYPDVVRVLPGTHESRPSDPADLAKHETVFSAMMPLGSALESGRLDGEKIGHAAIPEAEKAFPTFKMPIRDKDGGVAYWWFWDGEGLSYAADLSPKAEKYPTREVMTIERFLEKLG